MGVCLRGNDSRDGRAARGVDSTHSTERALTSATGAEPAQEQHKLLQRVFRTLERVERKRADGSGVLTLGSGHVARAHVIMHRGRVCLVATERTVLQSLRDTDPEGSRLLADAGSEAKRKRLRLAEVLKQRDQVTRSRILDALKTQNARALIAVARVHLAEELQVYTDSNEPHSWASGFFPTLSDYDPDLAYSALDLYRAAAELLDDAPDDHATRLYARLHDLCELALLMRHDADDGSISLPVRFAGARVTSVTALRKIGFAAHRLCRTRALASSSVEPGLQFFGQGWNDFACAHGHGRYVLLQGSGVGERARVANQLLSSPRTLHPRHEDA